MPALMHQPFGCLDAAGEIEYGRADHGIVEGKTVVYARNNRDRVPLLRP